MHLVIQEVCEKVEKSERAVEKLQEEITQLKEAIKKQKKHSEENESKISIALYMGTSKANYTLQTGLSADFKQKGFSLVVCACIQIVLR